MNTKAVVLLSGGLDSAVTLALAVAQRFSCYALSFSYGQRHHIELQAAARVAKAVGAKAHRILGIELDKIGGSALTGGIPVPKGRLPAGSGDAIPITYVPARNTIFLACALGWAEVLEAESIFIGANAVDFSGYPDCRPEFIRAFETLANLATKAGVEGSLKIQIRAPLLQWSKSRIIQEGKALGLDFSITHSCYDPSSDSRACGRCDSCLLRQKGFREAGLKDPILYAED